MSERFLVVESSIWKYAFVVLCSVDVQQEEWADAFLKGAVGLADKN